MRLAVIGGGIAGLAAAWHAAGAGADVVVLESTDRLGGKIRTTGFAGRPVDEGADAFITRVPDALTLAEEVGLGDKLVAPATGQAALWLDGQLRPLPPGLALGVPTELGPESPLAQSGILSAAGLDRAAREPDLPGAVLGPDEDVALGELIARRFGAEVRDRLVDPLLGGINAGSVDRLSLEVANAQLAAVARRSISLAAGLREQQAAAGGSGGGAPASPFRAPAGGMEVLVDALRRALVQRGVEIRTGERVASVAGRSRGVVVAADGGEEDADAAVVATPAPVAASLLRDGAADAATGLSEVEYASVVLLTLAYPRHAFSRPLEGSGFLVPRTEGRLLTACSVFSNKWPSLERADNVTLRASAGRYGDERASELDDDELVGEIHTELSDAAGLTAAPTEVRVSRWPCAFPQFFPGHLPRIDAIEQALTKTMPRVALAGAYLRGVGIPAVVAGGRRAADRAMAAAR